ncbi:MAG: hypothetical protein R6W95_06500 [Desulfosarcina sp.]
MKSSEPDGTPRDTAHVAGYPRLIQARVHDADARRAHANTRCTHAYIACGTGLVAPGVHRADPGRTYAACDARPRCADTDARVGCDRRAGQAHDHGAQQECA